MSENPLTLLAVFAHPDDEAFGVGGTLSKYAAEGVAVYLVTATRGEAGEISDPRLATCANLPEVREQELRCACEVYGIHPPILLDYLDGHLPEVHQGQAVGKVVRLIRELRPQVLVTFAGDGIYGHYDHIAAHRWASIAYNLAADPNCFPDDHPGTCVPYQVGKLYYQVLSQEQAEAMAGPDQPAAVMMDGVPFPFVVHPDKEITTVVDVAAFVEKKLQGMRCHATQISEEMFAGASPEQLRQSPFARESFILGRSTVGWPKKREKETDLFARIR